VFRTFALKINISGKAEMLVLEGKKKTFSTSKFYTTIFSSFLFGKSV
jgi:hypothetical protein